MKALKKTLFLILSLVIAFSISGCFDLGSFENDEDYYDTFGEVRLVYFDNDQVQTKDYSVRDYFYNNNTVEDFVYGDPTDDEEDVGKDIPLLPYVYLAVQINKSLQLDSFSLYMQGSTVNASLSMFLVDELPDGGDFTDIRNCGDPEYSQKEDEGGNLVFDEEGNPVYDENKPISYSDPTNDSLVAQTSISVSPFWDSFTISTFNGGLDFLEVESGQYLLLRVNNNSGMGNKQEQVELKVINMLVRAIY